MKKTLGFVVLLALLAAVCLPAVWAAADTVVQFADPVLEQRIRNWFDRPTGDFYTGDFMMETYLGLAGGDGGEQITDLSGLEYFTNLEVLELYNNAVTDLTPLTGLQHLREVDLGGNQVSDLSPLAGKDLTLLALWENNVSDISALADMFNLEILDLCNNHITDISALEGKSKLTYLALGGNPIADYSPVADYYDGIAEKDFDLNATPPVIDEATADEVITFTDPVLEARVRQEIGVPDGDITRGTAQSITGLELATPDGEAAEDGIRSVEDLVWFSNLDYLNLSNNCIDDVWPLQSLTRLQMLFIAGNPAWDYSALGSLTALTDLWFDAQLKDISFVTNLCNLVNLTATGALALPDDLPALTNLRSLCVPGGGVEDISVLEQMPYLTVVDLSWNNVSDISALEGMQLTELYLDGNPIQSYEPVRDIAPNLIGTNVDFDLIFTELDEPEDPGQVIAFQDAVFEQAVRDALGKPDGDITAGDAAALTGFYHNNEWFTDDSEKICDITGIRYFINLRELGLNFNSVSDIGELEGLTKLTNLSIGCNNIADIGALAGMTELEGLDIFGIGATDISVLAGMENLRFLNADGVQMQDLSALAGLTQLEEISLSDCGLTDIAPLAGLTGLTSLNITENSIADISALAGKENLQKLLLDGNPIADYSPIAAVYPSLSETDFEYWEGRSDALTMPDDPGQTVTFPDPVLERYVRKALDKPEGELTAGELATITRLECDLDWQEFIPDDIRIHDLTGMEALLNLRTLTLSFHAASDLSPLRGLGKLVTLNIGGNGVSDITALENLTALEELRIFGNGITDISPLAGLTHLRTLQLDDNAVSDLTPLAGLTELSSLSLGNNRVSDLRPLSAMQNLQTLYLSGNPITDYSPIAEIVSHLTEMDFSQFTQGVSLPDNAYDTITFPDPVLEAAIREILQIPENEDIIVKRVFQQEALYLGVDFDAPDGEKIHDLTGLEYFSNLQELDLINQAVSDLTPLAGLKKLSMLDVSSTHVEDISPLRDSHNLHSLAFNGDGVTDLTPLAELTDLQMLKAAYNLITDLTPLSGLYNLTELELAGNPIEDWSPIAELYPRLENRDFEMEGAQAPGPDIDSQSVIVFSDPVFASLVRAAIGKGEDEDIMAWEAGYIDSLYLGLEWQEEIPEETRIRDISGIEYFTNLKNLSLNFHAVTDLTPLLNCTQLEFLDLGGNGISDISLLQNFPNLYRLTLFGNGLGDISALAGLKGLTYLDLSDNSISDISALAGLENLRELYLSNNPIADYTPVAGIFDSLTDKDFDLSQGFFQPEDPDAVVTFNDPVLESRVRELLGKPEGDITAADAAQVTELRIDLDWQEHIPDDIRIHDLTGIEYFINLQVLSLNFHAVTDIGMLPSLHRLTDLSLGGNGYADLGVLAQMPGLVRLVLFDDGITDVSPLAELCQLTVLYLEYNRIMDVSPLAGLTQLQELTLNNNPVEDYAPLAGLYPGLTEKDFTLP